MYLKLAPVVVRISLETRLARIATSLLVLLLRLVKNIAYLTRMSDSAELSPGDRTCCTKYFLVSLGHKFDYSFFPALHR